MTRPTELWTEAEVAVLSSGIDAGQSWAQIRLALLPRTEIAVRRKAAALGLAAQSERTPYPHIPTDDDGVNIGDDALLAALRREHGEAPADVAVRAGRAVISLARRTYERSLIGSSADAAACS